MGIFIIEWPDWPVEPTHLSLAEAAAGAYMTSKRQGTAYFTCGSWHGTLGHVRRDRWDGVRGNFFLVDFLSGKRFEFFLPDAGEDIVLDKSFLLQYDASMVPKEALSLSDRPRTSAKPHNPNLQAYARLGAPTQANAPTSSLRH